MERLATKRGDRTPFDIDRCNISLLASRWTGGPRAAPARKMSLALNCARQRDYSSATDSFTGVHGPQGYSGYARADDLEVASFNTRTSSRNIVGASYTSTKTRSGCRDDSGMRTRTRWGMGSRTSGATPPTRLTMYRENGKYSIASAEASPITHGRVLCSSLEQHAILFECGGILFAFCPRRPRMNVSLFLASQRGRRPPDGVVVGAGGAPTTRAFRRVCSCSHVFRERRPTPDRNHFYPKHLPPPSLLFLLCDWHSPPTPTCSRPSHDPAERPDTTLPPLDTTRCALVSKLIRSKHGRTAKVEDKGVESRAMPPRYIVTSQSGGRTYWVIPIGRRMCTGDSVFSVQPDVSRGDVAMSAARVPGCFDDRAGKDFGDRLGKDVDLGGVGMGEDEGGVCDGKLAVPRVERRGRWRFSGRGVDERCRNVRSQTCAALDDLDSDWIWGACARRLVSLSVGFGLRRRRGSRWEIVGWRKACPGLRRSLYNPTICEVDEQRGRGRETTHVTLVGLPSSCLTRALRIAKIHDKLRANSACMLLTRGWTRTPVVASVPTWKRCRPGGRRSALVVASSIAQSVLAALALPRHGYVYAVLPSSIRSPPCPARSTRPRPRPCFAVASPHAGQTTRDATPIWMDDGVLRANTVLFTPRNRENRNGEEREEDAARGQAKERGGRRTPRVDRRRRAEGGWEGGRFQGKKGTATERERMSTAKMRRRRATGDRQEKKEEWSSSASSSSASCAADALCSLASPFVMCLWRTTAPRVRLDS
ncbi:hypothetical protein B0H13DRAFT_1877527 [Mycena leptocephala]|nr:hypothetical protein B0H13DRAFT_1877527 [Mycena leptocephala]